MAIIYPSLISSDLLNLGQTIEQMDPYCDGYHLDIMDFHFVPNLTFGPDFVNAIRKKTERKLHIHLMVDYPERYIERFVLAPDDIICIHIESKTDIGIRQLAHLISKKGLIVSIAISPFTPLEALISLPMPLQQILLMSVKPGFSGQAFLPHTLGRLNALMQLKKNHKIPVTIAVDGGITLPIAQQLLDQGADELAIASAIFGTSDPIESLKQFSTLQPHSSIQI